MTLWEVFIVLQRKKHDSEQVGFACRIFWKLLKSNTSVPRIVWQIRRAAAQLQEKTHYLKVFSTGAIGTPVFFPKPHHSLKYGTALQIYFINDKSSLVHSTSAISFLNTT